MKKFMMPALALALCLPACKGYRPDFLEPGAARGAARAAVAAADVCSRPVAIPTANRMIKSYLGGIDYLHNTDAVRSWLVSADTLRHYLSEGKGKSIVRVKLMLAHTMAYIHSGSEGRPAPVNSHDVTIVMVGVDQQGDLVYNPEHMPYDYAFPCPPACLGDSSGAAGTAALDTLSW